MKTNDNGRAEARSRAERRLRRMTIGTALMGVVATGSLGGLAAFTYDGTTGSSPAVAAVTTNTTIATATPSATAAATATATAAPAVTATQGIAHATTGGS